MKEEETNKTMYVVYYYFDWLSTFVNRATTKRPKLGLRANESLWIVPGTIKDED